MKRILMVAVAAFWLVPAVSNAAVVSFEDGAYAYEIDIQTVTGTFNELSSFLEGQPWWGNDPFISLNYFPHPLLLAAADAFGFPNAGVGVIFALRDDPDPFNRFDSGSIVGAYSIRTGSGNRPFSRTEEYVYAYASRIEATVVPLPAALPLLAAGLGGLGFIGRRKKKAA